MLQVREEGGVEKCSRLFSARENAPLPAACCALTRLRVCFVCASACGLVAE